MQTLSQTTLTTNQRVKALVSNKDTVIVFSLVDAKSILTDVLQKQISDSLLSECEYKDSLKDVSIALQYTLIQDLNKKSANQELKINNLSMIIDNKDKEVAILNGTISKQKGEIKKQKFYKMLGFTAAVVLPILAIIFL